LVSALYGGKFIEFERKFELMKRFISLIFFAALAFGGELADLRDECEKGNKEFCRSLSNAIKNLELELINARKELRELGYNPPDVIVGQ